MIMKKVHSQNDKHGGHKYFARSEEDRRSQLKMYCRMEYESNELSPGEKDNFLLVSDHMENI